MNPLSRFIEPLGWALLHFLWQGAAVALLLMVFLRCARRSAPQLRYAASGAALLLMLSLAAGTVWWQMRGLGGMDQIQAPRTVVTLERSAPEKIIRETPVSEIPAILPAAAPLPPLSAGDNAPAPARTGAASPPAPAVISLAERLRPALPWLVGIWGLGVMLFSLRLMNGWRLVRRWRASGSAGVPAEWFARFAVLCGRMRISRPVQLLSSAVLTVPVVIGWLKPVVLVPAGLFSGIPAAQLEAILAHELAHVRRGDYLVNLLQTAVETVLFYHPAVWWVSAQLRKEREHCCDDAAASLDGDAIAYARALTALEELRAVPAAAAGVSAAGGSLLHRVRRLAGLPQECAGVAWPLGILTLAAVAASLSFMLPRSEAGEVPEKEKSATAGEGLTAAKEETPLTIGAIPATADTPAAAASPASTPSKKPSEMGVARAPLEGELRKSAFGETHASGLRAAWAFDPPQAAYALGSILKCRVIFHNNGKQEISFRTDACHQGDTWIVKNAAGQEVKVKTVPYDGLIAQEDVRLKPGEIYVVSAHGVGIGEGNYREAYGAGKIGAEIPAKEGDVLTCQWIVQVDHRQADPNWSPQPGHPPGTLTTGAIRFKVAAAGAIIEPITGVAKGTGTYDLAPGIKMQVTQIAEGNSRRNLATIEWYNANGVKSLERPIELTAGLYLDPIIWNRGGTAIWIVHGLVVRRIDYTNSADLKETVIKMDEAIPQGAAPPEVIGEIMRILSWQAEQVEQLDKEIKLPVPGEAAGAKDAIIVSIDKGGAARLSGEAVTDEQLTARLTAIAKTRPQQAVVIRAEQETRATHVYRVMQAVGNSGLTKISFAANKPSEKKPAAEPTGDSTSPEGAPASGAKSELAINVRADGSIMLNQQIITAEHLSEKLAEVAKLDKKQPIVIRGDVNTPYEKIVAVLNATHKAGLFHVSFATTKEGATPAHREAPPSAPGAGKQRIKLRSLSLPQQTAENTPEQQLKLANDLRARIARGEDFATLAKRYSCDSKQEAGGSWGWVMERDLSPQAWKVVSGLTMGQLSEVTALDSQTADAKYCILLIEESSYVFPRPGTADGFWAPLEKPAKSTPGESAEAPALKEREDDSALQTGKETGAAAGIGLTVTDSTGKVPVASFRVIGGVRAGSAGGKDTINWQPHTLRKGKDGGLIWPLDKAYDEMALRIEADGYYPQVFQWIEKKKGAQELFFQMKPSGPMRVHVLTPDGKPAVGALAILAMVQRDAVLEGGQPRALGLPPAASAADQWRRPRLFSADTDGSMQVERENDPTAAVLFTHESGVLEISFRALEESESKQPVAGILSVPVELKPWAKVQGKVLWGDKKGAGQKVSLTIHRDDYGYPGIVAQYEKTTAAADGSFVFEKVLPGPVQLSCPIAAERVNKAGISEINLTGRIAHVTLKPGDNPVVIGGGGRTIKGKLTGRDKWDGITFHFHPTAPHIGMPGDDEIWKAWGEFQKGPEGALYFRNGLKVQPDGTFEVPGVLPGDYQIFFKRLGEDKYLSSGNFSLKAESAASEQGTSHDVGEFKATP